MIKARRPRSLPLTASLSLRNYYRVLSLNTGHRVTLKCIRTLKARDEYFDRSQPQIVEGNSEGIQRRVFAKIFPSPRCGGEFVIVRTRKRDRVGPVSPLPPVAARPSIHPRDALKRGSRENKYRLVKTLDLPSGKAFIRLASVSISSMGQAQRPDISNR